jgi:hypothetical protein
MERAFYWLRWLALLPAAAAVYFGIQILMSLIGIPFVRGQIIDDPPGAVEVSSHFFWDWIVQPFAFMCIGAAAAFVALWSGAYVAPSHKVLAVRITAVIVLLWAFTNFVFALLQLRTASVSATLPALAANFQAGLVAVGFGLRLKSGKMVSVHINKMN